MVVGQVASDVQTMFIVDLDEISNASDDCIFQCQGHFCKAAVDHDSEIGQDLDFLVSSVDGDGLLGDHASVVLVVDDDGEFTIDEVTGQEVAAFAGELEELLVKGHEVL